MNWIHLFSLFVGLFVGFTLGAFTMCLMAVAKHNDCNPGSETGIEEEK